MHVLKGASSGLTVRAVPSAKKSEVVQAPTAEALALARADQEVARLTRAMDEAKTAAVRTERDAFEKGRAEGMKEASKIADERVRVLQTAVDAARETWDTALGSIDTLSAELVRTALAKVFEPSDDMAELTIRAVRRKLTELEQGSVVTVTVSAKDFPGEAETAALKTVVTPTGAKLDRSSSLRSGECRIELQLGERSIGPRDQWTVLSRMLDEFAAGDLAA